MLRRAELIAALRLRSLGDIVLMTPTLAALKAWRPDLRVAAIVEPRFADALAGNPDVERVLLAPEGWPARLATLAELRHLHPALVLGLIGLPRQRDADRHGRREAEVDDEDMP